MAEAPVILRRADIQAEDFAFRHPLDRNAEIRLFGLARRTGLANCGVTLAHLAPGKTSFAMHRHHAEEEWIYILSGAGELTLDDETHGIGAGDFAAFRPGGPAHKLTNTGGETLVYLMGGTSEAVEVVDFPEAGRRMTRMGGGPGMTVETAATDAFEPFDFRSGYREHGDG